jgi:5'(3')-deoxyribonucleotidase
MLNKNLKIYCDMDGVLANFEKEPNAKNRYANEKGFFANLEPISENLKAIKTLLENGYDVNILSASPNNNANRDKLNWLMKYLPNLTIAQIIFCKTGENKSDYAKDIQNALLIDDYSKNLVEWKALGGKALKVVNDYDNEIGTHTKYNIPYVKNLKELL